MIALNFNVLVFNSATGTALGFQLFEEGGQGFGFGLKAGDRGDGFAVTPFAGCLYSEILLGWGEFWDGTFQGGGVGACAEFLVDNAVAGGGAGVGGLALGSGHKRSEK